MIAFAEIEEKASDLAYYIYAEVYRENFVNSLIIVYWNWREVSDSEVFDSVIVRFFRRLNYVIRILVRISISSQTITKSLYSLYHKIN